MPLCLRPPAILDEIQHLPEVLNYQWTRIDANLELAGQGFLTGSQEAPLMRGGTESMAGRAAVFQLLPLSRQETKKVCLLHGGFPVVGDTIRITSAPKATATERREYPWAAE